MPVSIEHIWNWSACSGSSSNCWGLQTLNEYSCSVVEWLSQFSRAEQSKAGTEWLTVDHEASESEKRTGGAGSS